MGMSSRRDEEMLCRNKLHQCLESIKETNKGGKTQFVANYGHYSFLGGGGDVCLSATSGTQQLQMEMDGHLKLHSRLQAQTT